MSETSNRPGRPKFWATTSRFGEKSFIALIYKRQARPGEMDGATKACPGDFWDFDDFHQGRYDINDAYLDFHKLSIEKKV